MATKNSGISARLSLDSAPWEKSLRGAKKELATFTTDVKSAGALKLGTSFDGFTKSVSNATNELRRMKLQADSTTSSVERGMAAARNMASGAGAGLHMGAGIPGMGPNSRWNPPSTAFIGPRMAMPAAMTPDAALQKTNATLHLNGRLLREGAALNREFGRSAGNSGQGILQLGYALDDLQYGIKGVANNIPLLVQSFTGSMKAAGIVGIAVTAGAVLWNLKDTIEESITGAKALAAANEAAAESYQKLTDKVVAAGKAFGQARGQGGLDQLALQDAGRANMDNILAREERLLTVKEKLALAETARLEGVAKMRAELEVTHAAEVRAATADLKNAEARYDQDQAQMVTTAQSIKLMEREIELLKEKEKQLGSLSAKDQARVAQLEEELPLERKRLSELNKRAGGLYNEREDARQRLEKELPGEKAAHEMEIRITSEKEKAAAAEKKRKAAMDEFQNTVSRFFSNTVKKMEEIAEFAARKARGETTQRDLAISEIRNPRRRERAERAASLADETQRLINEEGMTPAQAADVASRQQRVQDRESGRRTIRGAQSGENTASGLDAFNFNQRGTAAQLADGNVPTALETSEARGRDAMRRAKTEADRLRRSTSPATSEAGKHVSEILNKLDQLIQASGKTPAERAAPVRR